MPRRLYRQERLDATLKQLQKTGYVSVTELGEMFDVSTVTVRADLDLLERSGHLLRTHGGAVPINLGEGVLSFSVRQRTNVQAKERIGAAAAKLVPDGEAIVLDASTTAWHVARFLLTRHDLTVLTSGLYVALELLRAPGISVMVPGGRLWREAAAVVGSVGQNSVDRPVIEMGNLHQGFFSGRGFTIEEGLTDANSEEVELKRQLIDSVRVVNVLVDASKLGVVAFSQCAPIERIHRVITNREAPKEFVQQLTDRGIEVVLS
jgi:DeoR family transcriptional regulator, fructose operon transcriptional repressor